MLSGLVCLFVLATLLHGQDAMLPTPSAGRERQSSLQRFNHERHARRFLAGRSAQRGSGAAIASARRQHAAMLDAGTISLGTTWQSAGPMQVTSLAYGKVTGRIASIAIDPADATGNTVYVGTTGGGIWKSANAAGPAADVTFTPLTDTLPVFALDSGHSAIASLSIGALSVANGIILAGTGDTNDALDSYYGSGLLRSTDSGATWTLTQQAQDGASGMHSFVGLGFAGLAWSTINTSLVVAAVSDAAEGEVVNAANTIYSTRGLYFSTDAGVTWQMATIRDGNQIVQQPLPSGRNDGGNAVSAVVWNPVRQRFYAAVRFHGYYESIDGANWTRLLAQPGSGLTVNACPAKPGGAGSASCPIFRGALAVEPQSGDTYAFTVDASNRNQGIWRDACMAVNGSCSASEIAFATKLHAAPLEDSAGIVAQGDYDLALAAVASGNSTQLYAGTLDLYRCTIATSASDDGGCAFRNTTNVANGCAAPAMVAPGQHAVVPFTGSALPLLFIGNDGGLWRSLDGVAEGGSPCSPDDASHFDNLNGSLGSLAEVVQFAQHPTDPDTLLAGLGANGTAATSSASDLAAWTQLSDGEGGYAAIDPAAPLHWYISTEAGVSITACDRGAACRPSDFNIVPTIGAPQVQQDASLIDAPWLLDPALSSNVLIGTCRAWRGPASDSAAWPSGNVLSTGFGTAQSAPCGASSSFVRSLTAGGKSFIAATPAQSGSTTLYAGMAGVLDGGGNFGGHLFSTTAANLATATTAWQDLSSSPVTNDAAAAGVFNQAGFDVSSITVDLHDSTGETVYATIMGFSGNGVDAAHVYRSVDGGAHWTNISSNLPDAPANSVVVDPNDSATVYVAMDTGVYVTNQVANCSIENCWSIYGSGLPNAPVMQLTASATLPAGNGVNGLLRAGTYGRGIWEIPLLSAAPVTSAAITLSPASLTFSAQATGSTSAPQSIAVRNTGNAPLLVTSILAPADFMETDSCNGASIAAGGTCMIQVTYMPSGPGSESGTLTVYANVPGGNAVAVLSGTGALPGAVLPAPSSVNFGTVAVGQTSAAQTVTITNTGGVPVTLSEEFVTGDFQLVSNTCGATLAAGGSCAFSIDFSPVLGGTRNGRLTIADSAGTQLVSLTGTGASKATDTLSPVALNFAAQIVGTPSDYNTVFLTNTGDTALTGISAQIGSDEFVLANHCGPTLSGHAACDVEVAFEPAAAGPRTGSLTVSDEYGSQTVPLTGTGLASPAVVLTPDALTFAQTTTGGRSGAQVIYVTNGGAGNLSVGSITVTGDFTEADNCANRTLYGPYNCNVQVTFAPTAAGTRTGTITVTGTLPGQVATATLTGAAVAQAAILLTPSSIDFGARQVGTVSISQSVAISNTGGVPATLNLPAVSGDYQLTANTCGPVLAPGVGCTVSISFSPLGAGTRSGALVLHDSVGTQTAALTGIGTSPPNDRLTPTLLTFGAQQAGTASAPQIVTLNNTGDNPLTLIASHITNGPFTVTDGCSPVLSAHSTCTFQVTFVPTTPGPATGGLVVIDALRTQTVPLLGTATGNISIAVAPAQLNFPSTQAGQTSAAQSVTVSNPGSGEGQLKISAVAVNGPFTETDNCVGKSLTSAACLIQVTFAPASAGTLSGTLTITGTAAGQQAVVALSGVGATPASISLVPQTLSFGSVDQGMTSVAQNLTISNTGGVPAALQTITITGDFSITAETCGLSLPPQTGCTVSIIFTPKAAGLRTGFVSITDTLGTQTVALSGTGTSIATDSLAPLSLTFGAQQAGTASATQSVTLTNGGDDTLTLIAATVSNSNFTATNTCGPKLAGHSSCAIQVAFTPTRAGSLTAMLTVSDQLRSQSVGLSGVGHAPPTIALVPSSLLFPATPVGSGSAAQTVTVTNSGDGQLTVGSMTTAGDFSETDTCTGKILSGDATCIISVVFHPNAAGARSGTLTVAGTEAGQTTSISLAGTGAPPAAIVLDPTSVTFGLTTLGTSSAAVYVTISNTGGVAATLDGVSLSGDFSLGANTCGATLAPSTGCTAGIIFTPTLSGTRTGTFTVRDSAGTQVATLSGIGQSSATDGLSPLSLTFAPQQIDTRSAAQVVMLSNNGDDPLTLVSAQVTSGDFAASSACGSSLIGHSSCAVSVVSVPKNVGPYSGVLTVADQFRSQTVALSGTGTAPPGITLSPLAGLNFAPTGVTTKSAPQAMTLTNNGGGPLAITSIKTEGDFAIPAATNTCPDTLAVATACSFQVLFAPVIAGPRTGTISIATNAPGGQPALPLTGTGVDFTLYPDGATSVTVSSGSAAEFPLLLSSAEGIPGVAALTCTGAPAHATCVITPASVPLGAATTISLTVDTGVAVAQLEPAHLLRNAVWWVLVAPVLLPFASLRRWRRASFAGLLCLLLASGCGSGRTIPPGPGGGGSSSPVTPSGTYTITASASSAGLTRSAALTLIVK